MKRRIILSIALFLSIGSVLLTNSDSTVKAQNQLRIIADTGVIKLGPNQILRISGDGVDQDDVVTLRFRQISYSQGICGGGVCKHVVESQTTSDPIMLAPNETAVVDASDFTVWRMVVFSNKRNVQVKATIVDTVTGQVDSVLVALLLP